MKKTENIEEVATIIVDTAIRVHEALGPGLLESTYQVECCLDEEGNQTYGERAVKTPRHTFFVSFAPSRFSFG